LLDQASEIEEVANRTGFRYFTQIADFRDYIRTEILGEGRQSEIEINGVGGEHSDLSQGRWDPRLIERAVRESGEPMRIFLGELAHQPDLWVAIEELGVGRRYVPGMG